LSLLFPARVLTVDAAVRDLTSSSVRARLAAALALGDAPRTDQTRAQVALRAALEDERAEVRAAAATALGSLCSLSEDDRNVLDDATIAALVSHLEDDAPPVRQGAAIALGSARAPGGFVPLAKALRDGPPDLRFQAATSLCEIDPIAAYDPLVTALDDRDPLVLGAIALGLGATGDPRATGHLARLLGHSARAVRFDAAYALAQVGDGRGQEILAAALTDDERDWDAACALAELGRAEAAAPLAALLGRRGTSPQVQSKAVRGDHLEQQVCGPAALRRLLSNPYYA
jgi:HEAT repeat protein